MTSDYLKQLQLTKQLEQKAKEAAKHRKAAEDKLAEAERSLALAKSLEIETHGVQKTLAEGHAAYGKREYAAALATATKVLEDLLRLQGEKVDEVLSSALAVLGMLTEVGKDRRWWRTWSMAPGSSWRKRGPRRPWTRPERPGRPPNSTPTAG